MYKNDAISHGKRRKKVFSQHHKKVMKLINISIDAAKRRG